MRTTQVMSQLSFACLLALNWGAQKGSAATTTASFTGAWQLSWEARIGTETGKLNLRQTRNKLAGTFEGRQGSIPLEGDCDAKKVSFTLNFAGSHPYTLAFKGARSGGEMSGNFEVQGVAAGYDSHGENVRPTNYTWTATRLQKASAAAGSH